MGFSNWTVLIGRTGFDTILSVPDLTLSLNQCALVYDIRAFTLNISHAPNRWSAHSQGPSCAAFRNVPDDLKNLVRYMTYCFYSSWYAGAG